MIFVSIDIRGMDFRDDPQEPPVLAKYVSDPTARCKISNSHRLATPTEPEWVGDDALPTCLITCLSHFPVERAKEHMGSCTVPCSRKSQAQVSCTSHSHRVRVLSWPARVQHMQRWLGLGDTALLLSRMNIQGHADIERVLTRGNQMHREH